MPHVLLAGSIHADGIAIVRDAPGFTHEVVADGGDAAYLPYLPKADGVLLRVQPLRREHIESAPNLKIVSRHGVGYDSVDLAALTDRSIALAVVGDVNSRGVAEHTLMLILACAKQVVRSDRAIRSGDWDYRNRFEAVEVDGRTLLICGFGRIGRLVASMAKVFNLNVLVYDPFQPAEAIAAAGAEAVPDLDAALPRADYVTIHAPKMGDTALLGANEFERMKPGACVINTARGGMVDEAALIAALDAGRLAGAGLDVFHAEPPAPGDPLLKHERVILTPHTAGIARETARRMSIKAAQNIVDFFIGTLDPALVVNHAEIAAKGAAPAL